MQLAVTFRHMEATPALKEYAKEKVDRINKYFPDPIKAHVVMYTDRKYHHVADVMITLHNGFVIKGEESTEDMYSSIDLVMAKIERQVRRYKEKLRGHRQTPGLARELNYSVVTMQGEMSPGATSEAARAPAPQFQIVKKDKFVAQPLAVEEAIIQMSLLGNTFLVFTNAATREVNVVYKRDDGTYGLIESNHNGHAA